MAGLGGKNWSFQEEVTSSDVNGFLADQVVMRFADDATRTAGFGGSGEPVLAEGMMSYLDDANRLDVYTGAAWTPVSKVLQVVSTTKTDTYSANSSAFTTITGLTATITPSSASSKIFVIASVAGGVDATASTGHLRLVRDSTPIAVGTSTGSRVAGTTMMQAAGGTGQGSYILMTLDSPNSNSAITYAVQETRSNQSATIVINRSLADTDNAQHGRTISTIALFEVAS
jgi:hypothetical protein